MLHKHRGCFVLTDAGVGVLVGRVAGQLRRPSQRLVASDAEGTSDQVQMDRSGVDPAVGRSTPESRSYPRRKQSLP